MKKILEKFRRYSVADWVYLVMAALFIVGAVFLIVSAARSSSRSCYPLTTVVVWVSEPNDTVTCRDFNGNYWQFHGTEDWQTGDVASLLMDDGGTKKIRDDTVVLARYDGWIDAWRP